MDINDIKQGRHGDCFILASIISILYTLGENQIKNIIKDDTNSFYYFSFWNKNKKFSIKLDENKLKTISPKSKKWVKKIEYGYIYVFYKNNINRIIEEGGISQKVLHNLLGIKPDIFINRLFDNINIDIFKNISKEISSCSEWNNNFVTIDIKNWLNKIWNSLVNISDLKNSEKNKIFKLNYPAIVGTYSRININGIVNEHTYSILGIMIDNYSNKYLQVFNPHRNVDSRKTIFLEKKNKYFSKIEKDRIGIWSLDECCIYVSDFTIY